MKLIAILEAFGSPFAICMVLLNLSVETCCFPSTSRHWQKGLGQHGLVQATVIRRQKGCCIKSTWLPFISGYLIFFVQEKMGINKQCYFIKYTEAYGL